MQFVFKLPVFDQKELLALVETANRDTGKQKHSEIFNYLRSRFFCVHSNQGDGAAYKYVMRLEDSLVKILEWRQLKEILDHYKLILEKQAYADEFKLPSAPLKRRKEDGPVYEKKPLSFVWGRVNLEVERSCNRLVYCPIGYLTEPQRLDEKTVNQWMPSCFNYHPTTGMHPPVKFEIENRDYIRWLVDDWEHKIPAYHKHLYQKDMRRFLKLLKALSGNNDNMMKYLLRYMAYLLYSGQKTQVMPILYSEKKGIGKSTLSKIITKLVGQHNTFNTSAQTMNSTFTGVKELTSHFHAFEDAVLVKSSKAAKDNSHSNIGLLKSRITEDTVACNIKNREFVNDRAYFNYFASTNKKPTLVLENDDRRFIIIECQERYTHKKHVLERLNTLARQRVDEDHFFVLLSLYLRKIIEDQIIPENWHPYTRLPITSYHLDLALQKSKEVVRFLNLLVQKKSNENKNAVVPLDKCLACRSSSVPPDHYDPNVPKWKIEHVYGIRALFDCAIKDHGLEDDEFNNELAEFNIEFISWAYPTYHRFPNYEDLKKSLFNSIGLSNRYFV